MVPSNLFEESIVSAMQNDSSKLMITAKKDKSFECSSNLKIALNSKEQATVTMNKIQVQPFGDSFGEGTLLGRDWTKIRQYSERKPEGHSLDFM